MRNIPQNKNRLEALSLSCCSTTFHSESSMGLVGSCWDYGQTFCYVRHMILYSDCRLVHLIKKKKCDSCDFRFLVAGGEPVGLIFHCQLLPRTCCFKSSFYFPGMLSAFLFLRHIGSSTSARYKKIQQNDFDTLPHKNVCFIKNNVCD